MEIVSVPTTKLYCSNDPEQIAFREKWKNELKFKKKWEWSNDDLLMSLDDYAFKRVTKEEGLKELPKVRKYIQQLHQSDGFDIDVTPNIGIVPPGIYPISRTEKQLQKYGDLAELALETYNKENDRTNYQFVKVLKVNVTPSWEIFYITFTAKYVSPRGRYRSPKTFQAKVSVPVYQPEIPAKVRLCRLKSRY